MEGLLAKMKTPQAGPLGAGVGSQRDKWTHQKFCCDLFSPNETPRECPWLEWLEKSALSTPNFRYPWWDRTGRAPMPCGRRGMGSATLTLPPSIFKNISVDSWTIQTPPTPKQTNKNIPGGISPSYFLPIFPQGFMRLRDKDWETKTTGLLRMRPQGAPPQSLRLLTNGGGCKLWELWDLTLWILCT